MSPRDDQSPPQPGGAKDPGRDLATVHRLPVPQGEVLEGELVTEAEYRRLISQKGRAIERYRGYRRDVAAVAGWTRRTVTHRRTRTGAKFLVRHVVYVAAGLGVVAKRVWEAKTNSRYERLLRSAEAAGDYEALLEWESRAEQAKTRRHQRVMDWLTAPWQLFKALLICLLTLVTGLLLLGVMLAVASEDVTRVLDPVAGFLDLVEWVVWAVTIAWTPLLLAAPWVAVLWLWHLGSTRASVPHWVAPPAEHGDARDIVPDEGAILAALRNLGLSKLDKKVKEGWIPRWVTAPHRDGKGWRAQLELPMAVPVADIVDKQDVLAHNLVRLPVEVWPTEPRNQPGVLDLWVADPGALSGPVDPWPLLTEGTCDFFKGVPVGVDIRGNVITGRLFEANYGVAGMMGSGKSTLVITLLCGAILDPLVDVDVFVFAENADYDPLKPRLRTLVTGAEPENVTACLQLLRELFSELGVRGRALQEHGERKVNRKLAEQDERLRPRIVVIDECQNLFLSEHGGEAEELVVKLVTTARKYGITLVFVTPEPSSDSLPRKVVAVLSNKACYAIGDQLSNDAILGTGSYKAGISAVSLEPKTADGPGDIGTAMCRGFQSRPGLLRSYYIRKEAGVDEVTPVVERALALREQAGITTPRPQIDAAPSAAETDPLDDIAAVLAGHHRLRTQQVLSRLAARDQARYGSWTHTDLYNALPEAAKPYKTEGVMQVSRDRVLEAIAERDEYGGADTAAEEGADEG